MIWRLAGLGKNIKFGIFAITQNIKISILSITQRAANLQHNKNEAIIIWLYNSIII